MKQTPCRADKTSGDNVRGRMLSESAAVQQQKQKNIN